MPKTGSSGKTGKSKKISTNIPGRKTKIIGDDGWSGLFASRTLASLLTLFTVNSDRDFYQKELVRATGSGLFTVQRELLRLSKAGLVKPSPRGNRVYYRARREHPAFEDLKRLILKTLGLGEALREALASLAGGVQAAFIYGSFARGEERPESDLDLLFVGDLSPREASAVLGPLARKLGREFNPVIYPPEEFRAKIAEGHHFLTEVMKGEKLFILGDENELERLAC